MDQLTLTAADDMHCHVREGALLEAVIAETANQFRRAIIMPNLADPIRTVHQACDYRDKILKALAKQSSKNSPKFTPLMTLYVTEGADPQDYKTGYLNGDISAAKLYPAHATTNSAHGVKDVSALYPLLSVMSEIGMPLLIHGEVTDPAIDIFDREEQFIEQILKPLRVRFPDLKVVLEHITTAQAAQFIMDGDDLLAATITPHHMMLNRNALFQGGLRPHHYCLPILKHEQHRIAILKAATSGHPRLFAGTDSAPHPVHLKEQDCGCAGIYNGFNAVGLYTTLFEQAEALTHLEGFLSLNGARFYGISVNEETITVVRKPLSVPENIIIDEEAGEGSFEIKPFLAGQAIEWQLAN